MQYTNRKGKIFFLQAGMTRTGKPRYWFGRKMTGEPVESVPEGFEVYEHPHTALVSLRKIQSSEISPLECELVADGVRRHAGLEHFIVDVEGDSLVVYLPGMSDRETDQALEMLADTFFALPSRLRAARESMMRRSNYTKMMRFTLVDVDERLFDAERWCFRGSIDDWMPIGRSAPLEELVREYGQHLGKESFYDLM